MSEDGTRHHKNVRKRPPNLPNMRLMFGKSPIIFTLQMANDLYFPDSHPTKGVAWSDRDHQ